jgi:glycosyltransferase involved in cell wall biosynthesis
MDREKALRLAFVIGAFWPSQHYGGPIQTTARLCRALAVLGADVTVVTTTADGRWKDVPDSLGWRNFEGCRVCYAPRIRPTLVSPRFVREISAAVREAPLVHITGLFDDFFPFALRACSAAGVPTVVSPRGCLIPAALKRRRTRKGLYKRLILDRYWPRIGVFHATSEEEAASVRSLFPQARVAVVPNGVDGPSHPLDSLRESAAAAREPAYLLYLGRLHPYKQIDRIIRAFAAVTRDAFGRAGSADTGSPIELWIAGAGEPAFTQGLMDIAHESGVASRVRWLGHIAGEEKSRLLAQAEGLILASKSESFGMCVAEALSHGVPCIVTRTAPWSGLESEGCGYWVENSEEALTEGIRRLLTLSAEERRTMGRKGREWMERDFSWDGVARRMLALYESLLSS